MESWDIKMELDGTHGLKSAYKPSFWEDRSFNSLQEAVITLLKNNEFLQFGTYAAEYEGKPKFEKVILFDRTQPGLVLTLLDVPITDRINAGQDAGIYIGYPGHTVALLEENLGVSLKGFEGYGPDDPYLQLARYTYDKGFAVVVDPATINLEQSLVESVKNTPTWQYQVLAVEKSEDYQDLSVFRYHHPTLKDALAGLLQLDIANMDPSIAETKGNEKYLSEVTIVQNGDPVAIMKLQRIDPDNEALAQREAGIYLNLFRKTEALDQELNFQLNISHSSGFSYGESIKLGDYDKARNNIVPTLSYFELISNTTKDWINNEGYRLEVELFPVQGSADPGNKTFSVPHTEIKSAIQQLYQIDRALFEQGIVKNARIVQLSDNVEVASIFLNVDTQNLPVGVYAKINQDPLSLEILRAVTPYLNSMKQAGTPNNLIWSQNPEEDGQVQRKSQHQNQERLPPGTPGKSL